jgi:integrase
MPCPQESYSQWAAPLRLAVLYDLRRSELLGLRWSIVNLKAGRPVRRRPFPDYRNNRGRSPQ